MIVRRPYGEDAKKRSFKERLMNDATLAKELHPRNFEGGRHSRSRMASAACLAGNHQHFKGRFYIALRFACTHLHCGLCAHFSVWCTLYADLNQGTTYASRYADTGDTPNKRSPQPKVPHMPVDVQTLGADWLVASGSSGSRKFREV